MPDRPGLAELWVEAKGDSKRYVELLVEHGIVVPNPPCPRCGERFRHRHTKAGAIIRLDIFGHDARPVGKANAIAGESGPYRDDTDEPRRGVA